MSIRYIFSKIRKQTLSASILPFLCLAFFTFVAIDYPFFQIFFPQKLSDITHLEEAYETHTEYVVLEDITLHYTGYDSSARNKVTGRYFYAIKKNKCFFFLLNSKEALETADSITLTKAKLRLSPTGSGYDSLLTGLSEDMDWSYTHLAKSAPSFIAVENEYIFFYTVVFALVLFCFSFYFFSLLFRYLLVFVIPFLHKGLFPKASFRARERMFQKLSKELSEDTLELQWASSDKREFFLTDSFIINFSPHHTRVIPQKDIIWIYKHIPKAEEKHWDSPGKYTLHLLLKNGQHIPFKNYEETNADALIALLSSKNPDLLVGYSREHLILAKQYLHYIQSKKGKK